MTDSPTTVPAAPAAQPAHPAYDDLIASLDLRAKVRLLTGATSFTLWGDPSIGLAEMAFSDGPTGVRGLKFTGGEKVALFPNATLLASAWDPATAREVGEMLAEEAQRQHIHVVLGPTINLHRTVLGGRLFEAYSEDPLLTGVLATAYVNGMQSKRVAACLKHLVANESEIERNFMDSRLSEKALREVYLLPFEMATVEANPWSMMDAYNRINGASATENVHVNNEIVKGEWAWDGLLMSDWFATKTTVPTANGGLDLVMPGPGGPWEDQLVAAVEAGEVAESDIDDKVRRLLRLADRTGALGTPREWGSVHEAPDSPKRREQLTRLAAGGMTVLTNEGGVLPLAEGASVALIGRPGVATVVMGGGSATVNPPYQTSIATGLTALLGDRVSIFDGPSIRERALPAAPDALTREDGGAGVTVDYLDADGVLMASAPADSALSVGFDDALPRPISVVELRGVSALAGRVNVGVVGTGGWTLTVGGATEEFVLLAEGHDPGEAMLKPPQRVIDATVEVGTPIVARVFLQPEGRPISDTGAGALDEAINSGMGLKGILLAPVPTPDDELIAAAAAGAAAADVAVVCVGLTEEWETESLDKATIALPGAQDALVEAVAAVARRTVVVVNAATPVLMPWRDRVDAILVVGLPGQEGGHAVAKVLLGELEPTGRLVTTYPVADGAAPAWTTVPDAADLGLDYTDGTFVGYRGYAPYGLAPEPAFWFGAGLGYSTWEYADASFVPGSAAAAAPAGDTVSVTVTNTGSRSSREVVQAYLRPTDPGEPIRLAGFAAVTLEAGASATVSVPLSAWVRRTWDDASGAFALLTGGDVLIARGLGDVRAVVSIPA